MRLQRVVERRRHGLVVTGRPWAIRWPSARWVQRLPRLRFLRLLLWATLLWPSAAWGHDGDIQWRSRQSAHIRISYPARLDAFAQRALRYAEDSYRVMAQLFRYRPPRRVEITVDDYHDAANGFAVTIPYDHVHLRAWPPMSGDDLAGNGDWLKVLIFHELAHVFHMAEAKGLPAFVNAVLGRTWLPNQLLPRMWKEGLAVYVETRHSARRGAVAQRSSWSHTGRIARPIYLARLRAAVRDGAVPKLSELTGAPLQWPRSRGWYVFGAWLLDYQARRYGHAKLRTFINRYGERLVPYGIQLLYRQVYGKSAHAIWAEAVVSLRSRIRRERQARAERAPTGRPLTTDGEWRGRVRAAARPGRWLVARAPNDGLARLEEVARDGQREVLRRCEMDCDQPAATPDGEHLLWIASRPYQRLYRRRYVLIAPRAGGKPRRLTKTARVRQFSLDPQGRWLVWSALDNRGLTTIKRARLVDLKRGSATPQVLARAKHHGALLGDPAVASDGTIYWTRGQGRRRAVWRGRWRDDGQVVQAARPLGGHLSTDGASVTWVSDLKWLPGSDGGQLSAVIERGSFRDAALLRLRPGARWRPQTLTDTGVLSAAVDANGELVTVEVGGRGYDLRRYASYDADTTSVEAPQIAEPVASTEAPPLPPSATITEAGPYAPRLSVWPRAWRPSFEARGASLGSLLAGAKIKGVDALALWRWEASATTTLDGVSSVALLRATCLTFEPTWTGTLGWIRGLSQLPHAALPLQQWVGRLDGAWRYPFARGDLSVLAGVRASWLGLQSEADRWLLNAIPLDPLYPGRRGPPLGGSLTASVQLAYDRSEFYPNSSVVERRRALALELLWDEPAVLAQARRLQANLTGRLTVKLGRHQALELRGRFGWAFQYNLGAPPLTVSGLPVGDVTQLISGAPVGDFGVVRGVSSTLANGRLVAGRGLAWGSMTWHVPLPPIGAGLELLPVYLGRLWMSLFVDAAAVVAGQEAALRSSFTGPGWAASVGGELRLGAETGYQPYGTVAVGGAWVLGGLEGWQVYVRLAP